MVVEVAERRLFTIPFRVCMDTVCLIVVPDGHSGTNGTVEYTRFHLCLHVLPLTRLRWANTFGLAIKRERELT